MRQPSFTLKIATAIAWMLTFYYVVSAVGFYRDNNITQFRNAIICIVMFGIIAIFATALIVKIMSGPRKLFAPTRVCVLKADYFKIVMESASHWTQLPYSTENARPAWYWSGFFTKTKGYLMTGFKMDWSKDPQKKPTGIELFDFMRNAPIEAIFVPEEIYERIQQQKGEGSIIELTEYGSIKVKGNYGNLSHFAVFARSFITDLSKKEVNEIRSIDNFVSGM